MDDESFQPSRPERQNSTVSSASSGGRTVRAASDKGRRPSSASQPVIDAGSNLFARWTGRGKNEDDESSNNPRPAPSSGGPLGESDPEAGPSDYWRRPPSPTGSVATPPTGWKDSIQTPWSDDPEDGPADVWSAYPTSPDVHSFPTPRLNPSAATPDADQDEDEYHRRLRDVFQNRPLATVVSGDDAAEDWDDSASGRVSSPSRQRGYDAEFRNVMGRYDEKEDLPGVGEEEFGTLGFPEREDHRSNSSPSTVTSSRDDLRLSTGASPASYNRKPNPYLHPSVSRLRSHMRSSSLSSQHSLPSRQDHLTHSRIPSHFSQMSFTHSDSASVASDSRNPIPPIPATPQMPIKSEPAFNFHPLRQLSAYLSLKQGGNQTVGKIGRPTVMDVRGMIAIGTEGGHVAIFSFNQDLQCVLGSEGQPPVTCVSISPDQTFVGVGYVSGDIRLYDLSNPAKPARTSMALPLKQVLSGRKEGHLQNSRILHIGFVGERHTSIVSGDEHGRAFWWSLGRVLGVDSNDVVRMLGSYPDQIGEIVDRTPNGSAVPSIQSSRGSKRATTLFAASPLPNGDSAHATQALQITALLTPVKLVVVAMRPTPKTWFRKMRHGAGGEYGALTGCATWLRAGDLDSGSDPVLAYSWGTSVRCLRIRVSPRPASSPAKTPATDTPEFIEGHKYDALSPIMAMEWYDKNHLLLVGREDFVLLDVRSMKPVDRNVGQTSTLIGQPFYDSWTSEGSSPSELSRAFIGNVRVYRAKVFLLSSSIVQVGTLSHWNDRILACVHRGDFLGAIQVALAYYDARALGNVIALPDGDPERRKVVGTRIRELMRASLDWAFSEDRMHDDTHYSEDGRGVDLTSLFEGLATSCIEACLAMKETDFLFDDTYESYASVGIGSVFLRILEPYIFDGRIREIPTNIIQALIKMHETTDELDLAEAIIWHVDPMSLDINQAITLCETHGLWDALIHIYTRSMRDYVAPLVRLFQVIQRLQESRRRRHSLVDGDSADDGESLVPDAYKLFAYIELVLSGYSYPTRENIPQPEAVTVRGDIYGVLFSDHPIVWPEGAGGEVILPDLADISYPYLHLLLRFDVEAFLHSMDIVFEDSYLNDTKSAFSRQSIMNIMLDTMHSKSYPSNDITLLHIFVARNLPKYPQFLLLPPTTLHHILVSLARDPDQSTREDRELAAEYLLSTYKPSDSDAILDVFESAGFYRILRSAYRRDHQWSLLVATLVRDPDIGDEIWTHLDDIVKATKRGDAPLPEVVRSISDNLPQLLDMNIRQTAKLVDNDIPSLHSRALDILSASDLKQMTYLRNLAEGYTEDTEDADPFPSGPSFKLNATMCNRYASLLGRHDSTAVVSFLDRRGPATFDLQALVDDFRDTCVYDGLLWALDRQGKTKETFETIGDILRLQGVNLGEEVLAHDDGSIHMILASLRSVSQMAVRLCQEHSAERFVEDLWFGVLHEIVELNYSVVSLQKSGGGDDENHVGDFLRSLVQDTLQSLVSSSSSSLSFPRLFKRLVDTSTAKSTKKGRAYSEFRAILTGMLDSYRAEGELLKMTTRLVQADLFELIQEMSRERQGGWRSVADNCGACGESLLVADVSGEQSVKVYGSGKVVHSSCQESIQSE